MNTTIKFVLGKICCFFCTLHSAYIFYSSENLTQYIEMQIVLHYK